MAQPRRRPLDAAARAAGYAHALSLWQVEVSLTQVFSEPSWGRRFFAGVIRDNLDLGRPDRVSLLFPTRLSRATPAPLFGYRTRVSTRGVQPSLHVDFKHSHVKQGWALRTETTDVQPTKALATLPHLRGVGQQINTRLLETERLSLTTTLPERPLLERVQQPIGGGPRRVPALWGPSDSALRGLTIHPALQRPMWDLSTTNPFFHHEVCHA